MHCLQAQLLLRPSRPMPWQLAGQPRPLRLARLQPPPYLSRLQLLQLQMSILAVREPIPIHATPRVTVKPLLSLDLSPFSLCIQTRYRTPISSSRHSMYESPSGLLSSPDSLHDHPCHALQPSRYTHLEFGKQCSLLLGTFDLVSCGTRCGMIRGPPEDVGVENAAPLC